MESQILEENRFDRYFDDHFGENQNEEEYEEPDRSSFYRIFEEIPQKPKIIQEKVQFQPRLVPEPQEQNETLDFRKKLLSRPRKVENKTLRKISLKQDKIVTKQKSQMDENANVVDTVDSTESSEKTYVQNSKIENEDVQMNFQIDILPEKVYEKQSKRKSNQMNSEIIRQSLNGRQPPVERTHYKSLIRAPQKKKEDNHELAQQLILKSAMTKVWFNYAELISYIFMQIVCCAVIGTTCIALWSDLVKKHKSEIKLYQLQMSECRYDYQQNRCEEPVPQTREFCLQQEKCLLNDPGNLAKNVNILSRLIVEAINDFSGQISNRALFVIGAIIFTGVSAIRLSQK